jgi:hypothetical protein
MTKIIPETNFPENPTNRWREWTGILSRGDEKHIFTNSVCKYLYYHSYYKHIFEEELDAGQVITQLYLKFRTICKHTNIKERTIQSSLGGRVLTLLRYYINHFFQKKTEQEKRQNSKRRLLYQHLQGKEEIDFFWTREFEQLFYKAVDSLSELEKEIIIQKISGKDISKIARGLEMERHRVEKLYKRAAYTIDSVFKAHKMDLYRW